MAKETNQILGHGADADGIEEYDNPLPDWWVGMFIFTIIYGIGYAINYHFIADDSQEKRYAVMMEEEDKSVSRGSKGLCIFKQLRINRWVH